jgi:hypothetical protein
MGDEKIEVLNGVKSLNILRKRGIFMINTIWLYLFITFVRKSREDEISKFRKTFLKYGKNVQIQE